MGNIKNFFDSFKEFIWDIIGYLLPGSYILILLSTFINEEFFIYSSLDRVSIDFSIFTFIVLSYLLGHVVYGLGLVKEECLNKRSYTKKIEDKIAQKSTYVLSKELLSKLFIDKGISTNMNDATVRDMRRICMSYIPEHEQKIYMFTFRSDLSNQIGNISLLVGVLGLIFSIFKCIPYELFKTNYQYVIIYACLITCYYLLRYTRNRFYEISIELPFSIYIAKAIRNEL